ncbi:MAG: ATPase, T2SS/T4P/T4SS family [Ilumatobacteraceae bacterium]
MNGTVAVLGIAPFDPVAERSRLGGLERWLTDPAVTEVMVNAGSEVWVERDGTLDRVGTMRPAAVLAAIEQVLGPIGRRLDRASPTVDARLHDGSRVCAVIPPVAVDGPTLSIRRFAVRPIALGAFTSPEVVALLQRVVAARCNVVVSGPTSSGKTTLLNALAAGIGPSERIVTLEDIAELRLGHPHVVRLETRPASPDGVGAVGLADLVRTALRLRPDRLVVGEVRSAESVELLQAMNTGHDGSLSTVHANSATDVLARIASLVVQHVPGWRLADVREHVGRAIDVVVHVTRGGDGRRRIDAVVEVSASDGAVRVLARDGHVVAELHRRRR